MLVKELNEATHRIVMAIVIDRRENDLSYVYSMNGDGTGQYISNAKEHTVVDDAIPDYWNCSSDPASKWIVISFPEWVSDRPKFGKQSFYERYIDGDPEAVAIFKKYYDIEKQKYADDPHIEGNP